MGALDSGPSMRMSLNSQVEPPKNNYFQFLNSPRLSWHHKTQSFQKEWTLGPKPSNSNHRHNTKIDSCVVQLLLITTKKRDQAQGVIVTQAAGVSDGVLNYVLEGIKHDHRSGPTMNQVFKRFIVSDPQNTQTVAFEAFNSMSNDLAVAGSDAGVNVRFDDGIITLSEVFLVCGFQLPELPVSVNQLATVFRQIDGGTGTVDFVSFLRQLEYSVEYEGNPEDEQVTFEQAIAKVAGPLCPLKLNTLKDSIRRWSKEGNGRIDSTELRQFARFFELNIESDAETLGLKELLPLVISDQSKAYYQTPLDMDEMMKAFEWCDVDHTGKLSSDQLAKAMRLAGHNPSQGEFRKLKAEMDLNRDGVFDFDEFTEICCASYITPDEMRRKTMAAFHVFDTEKTGRITVDDLRRIFSTYGEDMSPEEMDAIFRELGLDEAGNMDVGELVTLLLS